MTANKKSTPKPIEPPSVDKYNWLIHLQHVRGEIDVCKNFIKKHIYDLHIQHEYALFKEGVILRDEGKLQEALQLFQKCYKMDPKSSRNMKEIGKCLFYLKRFRLSLDAYMEAEKNSLEPDWEIFHNIAECYLRLGDTKKAREFAQKAVQYGKQEESFALLTKIFDLEGDIRSAIVVCSAAIEACPDNIDMMTQLGMFHLRLRETQMAFEILTSALAVDPECTKALLGVGCIAQAHGEYDVALSKYKTALQTKPESVALWNNIGVCFYSKQKYVAAVSCLKRALWLSPLNWKVLFNLGLVYLATLQPASAFCFLCAAVNIRPDVSLCFTVIGYSLMELQDPSNALQAFKQAYSLAPKKPIVMANLGVCLYAMGKHQEAYDAVQKIIALIESEGHVDNEIVELVQRLLNLLQAHRKVQEIDNIHSAAENDKIPQESVHRLNGEEAKDAVMRQDDNAVENDEGGDHFSDPDEV